MTSTDLTKRQLAVLQFIRAFVKAEGRSPTLSEIGKGVGSSAVSTIHKHVQHLIDKGFLGRSHGKGNNIVMRDKRAAAGGLSKSSALNAGAEADFEAEAWDDEEGGGGPAGGSGASPRIPHLVPARILPFCGDVAAGAPLIPETRALPVEVPNSIHRERDDLFVLRVRGDSMIEDAILDGDLVVLQRKAEVRNGERVVALIDGEEATLKEYRKDKQGVWLIPHNPELKPTCYDPRRIDLQGVLVGVMRSC
ncbi:MAG: repressor LexA [Holophagaceae bacterium]|nr:repressor LexA [Holophagaceae bacterium]